MGLANLNSTDPYVQATWQEDKEDIHALDMLFSYRTILQKTNNQFNMNLTNAYWE